VDTRLPAAVTAGVIEVDEAGRTFDVDGTEFKRFGFHTFRTMYYSHARKRQKRDAQGMVLEAIMSRRVLQAEPEAIQ